jgi:hypothetical protein
MHFSPFLRTTQSKAWNGRFWPSAAEDGDAAWQQLAVPAPGLGLASDDPSLLAPGLGVAEDGARHGVAGTEAPLQWLNMRMELGGGGRGTGD